MLAHLNYELSLIQKIHQLRPEILDSFFILCNHLDSAAFYIFLVALPPVFGKYKWGLRCLVIAAITICLNYFLKHLFMQPRPFILDPNLALINQTSIYGLPSGAAQAAIVISGLIYHWFRTKLILALCTLYVAIVCCSRIYIGMHFFTDIIAGLFIGFLILQSFILFYPGVEKLLATIPKWVFPIVAFVCLGLLVSDVASFTKSYNISFAMLSGAVVIYSIYRLTNLKVENYPEDDNSLKLTDYFINIGILVFIYYSTYKLLPIIIPSLTTSMLVIIFISLLYAVLPTAVILRKLLFSSKQVA